LAAVFRAVFVTGRVGRSRLGGTVCVTALLGGEGDWGPASVRRPRPGFRDERPRRRVPAAARAGAGDRSGGAGAPPRPHRDRG
jgi:hypothetical protein